MQLISRPPATLALIGTAVLVFLLINYLGAQWLLQALLISQYLSPTLLEIRDGQLWRLITPIFMHFGIFHLVFNMLWTWELGKLIEMRHSALTLIGFTALLGIVSNLAQYWVSGPGFGGMSGVVYGYFGYIWIQGQFNPHFGIRLQPAVVYMLLGWFALAYSGVFEFFNLNIANTAHAAGLLGGILLAAIGIVISKIFNSSNRKHIL